MWLCSVQRHPVFVTLDGRHVEANPSSRAVVQLRCCFIRQRTDPKGAHMATEKRRQPCDGTSGSRHRCDQPFALMEALRLALGTRKQQQVAA